MATVTFRRNARDATRSSARTCAAPATRSCAASSSCRNDASGRSTVMSDCLSREPRPVWRALATLSATVYAVACLRRPGARAAPGDPLAGITPVEFEEFRLGLDDFLEVETAEEGLGPAFNGTSCAVCHNVPAVGGVGTIAELRAGAANADGEFDAARRVRRDALPPVLGSRPRLPADRSRPTPTSSRAACRFRSSAPDWSRPSPTTTLARARGSVRPRPRRRQRARGASSSTSPRASAASAASAGRRSTRRCWRSAPTPTATRWASPTTCFPTELASASRADAHAALRSDSRSGRHPRPADAPARHRQLRQLHALPGARSRARDRRRGRAAGEQVFARHRLRDVPRPGADDRAATPNPLFDRRPVAALLGSAAARRRHRRRHRTGRGASRTRSARRRCGACGSAARCCTTGRRRRSKRRSGATRRKPRARVPRSPS